MRSPLKTPLERLLVPERHRRQANQSGSGFSVPAISERPMDVDAEPLVVTNARGSLVPTRVSRARKISRYGFCECPLENEAALLPRFFSDLWRLSEDSGWSNRCTSLTEASAKVRSGPKSVVLSHDLLERISPLTKDQASHLMSTRGCISVDDEGVQTLVADLGGKRALLLASAPLLGFYTRVDIHLGVTLMNVDETLALVDEARA